MLTLMKRLIAGCAMALAIGGVSLSITAPAYAADDAKPAVTAPAAASATAEAPAAAPALVPNKADTVWMLLSTALVLLMTLPGLSLFYGGLTRSKNILSIMMQCLVIFSLISVLWAVYGYSLAFTEGSAFIGKFDRLFLAGLTPESVAATFSKGVVIPEFVFMAFQAMFATITCCLIIGAFAERAKFSAILCFMVLWFTFSYLPIAHMVWFWPGPDEIKDAASLDAMTAKAGWLFQKGVLDFAGGTVVHINAAVAGLVGSFVIGKRIGYGKESMKPHNMVLVMIGAALLWFGWFGFNAGSALEANSTAALAFINTYLATAAAVLGWVFAEWLTRGKPSMLGGASGCVAGLVAITPAAGFVGPMGAIAIGVSAGVVCLWGVTGLKKMLGSDDSLDVFGIHGVGGILGAMLTGVFAAPSLGGTGVFDYVTDKVTPDYSIVSQLWIQAQGVIVTVIWSAVVSYIAFKLVDVIIGLRVPEDQEREGLDVTSHGESAYES
ncbi:MAG: ammonium transporter [Sheuella sp.]|nr:ammonium transporter [Sheuella sp.]